MSIKFNHRKPYKLRGTRLLAAIVGFILAEPRRFHMDFFTKHVNSNVIYDAPECGTVACLAGWADVLTTGYVDTDDNLSNGGVERRARQVLGLSLEESKALFYVDYWPYEFRDRYRRAKFTSNRQGMADAAAARVTAFIEQKRKEAKRRRDARYRLKKRLAQAV